MPKPHVCVLHRMVFIFMSSLCRNVYEMRTYIYLYHLNTSKNAMKNKFYARKMHVWDDESVLPNAKYISKNIRSFAHKILRQVE